MSGRLLVQIVGETGAGKTEVTAHLSNTFGFFHVPVSGMIRNFAELHDLPLESRQDFNRAHDQLLRELGNYSIPNAVLLIPRPRISIDGMRVPAHAERLKTHYGAPIIALECPPELRFERTRLRQRTIDQPTFAGFLMDETQPDESDNPFRVDARAVIAMADYRIDSSRPLPEVLEEIDDIVSPLIADTQ